MKTSLYGFILIIFSMLVILTTARFSYLTGRLKEEIVIGIFSIIAFVIGLILTQRAGKTPSPSRTQPESVNYSKLKDLNISDREYQVLVEISKGLSNEEIAKNLFVSESTIKSHVSNLLSKLNAKRRTEALKNAKELGIII